MLCCPASPGTGPAHDKENTPMTPARTAAAIALPLAAAAATGAPPTETVSRAADRESTAVTVYNEDLALVKERRKFSLPAGAARVALRDVAAQMRPETALLRAATGPAIGLVEQNFDFDLLTPAKLLEKYVGKDVTVVRSHPTTGEERRETATVLSANGGTVLRFADRIETGVPGRLVFDQVPSNLRDRPTLSVLVEAKGGPQSVELSYLTGGLSWQADYVANLDGDGRKLDLSGWVTLTNRSGASYDDATLQLVAGNVNRVAPRPAFDRMVAKAAPMAAAAEMAQESLMDYHLYSFDRLTSIADQQTKQLALLSASGVAASRQYLLAGQDWWFRDSMGAVAQKQKPAIFLKFQNKGGQLGKPLPAGIVRVYARDSKGAAQFVGEDRIEHTAKNEEVSLRLGEAFDVTAERKQTSFRRVMDKTDKGDRNAGAEIAWRIEIRNAKDEAVTVRVHENLPGDWDILSENLKHTRESARVAAWDVAVPADGRTVLEYKVRVRW
jgi:hypothetical protein